MRRLNCPSSDVVRFVVAYLGGWIRRYLSLLDLMWLVISLGFVTFSCLFPLWPHFSLNSVPTLHQG